MGVVTSISGGGPGGGSGGAGGVGGSTGATDNAVLRADGTGGTTLQTSTVTIDDTGNVTFPARLLGKRGADAASGTDLTLGNGNYFLVTGTTQIEGIIPAGWTGGSTVILQFVSSVTVAHSGISENGDPVLLAGAANFSATAGDTLTLVRDDSGGFWREIARTVI